MYLFHVVLKCRGYEKIVHEAGEKHVLHHGPGSDVRTVMFLVDTTYDKVSRSDARDCGQYRGVDELRGDLKLLASCEMAWYLLRKAE
jgi:hypothetical protein